MQIDTLEIELSAARRSVRVEKEATYPGMLAIEFESILRVCINARF
jgi:hypothetical protein